MTSLHNQITEDFKVIHQSINTVSHQVTQLESGDQPVLVNGEQSLASTTGLPEQSLRHDAESSSTQSCRETQPAQEAPVDTSAQTRTDPLPGTNALKTILQTMKRLSTGPQLNLILSQESHWRYWPALPGSYKTPFLRHFPAKNTWSWRGNILLQTESTHKVPQIGSSHQIQAAKASQGCGCQLSSYTSSGIRCGQPPSESSGICTQRRAHPKGSRRVGTASPTTARQCVSFYLYGQTPESHLLPQQGACHLNIGGGDLQRCCFFALRQRFQ